MVQTITTIFLLNAAIFFPAWAVILFRSDFEPEHPSRQSIPISPGLSEWYSEQRQINAYTFGKILVQGDYPLSGRFSAIVLCDSTVPAVLEKRFLSPAGKSLCLRTLFRFSPYPEAKDSLPVLNFLRIRYRHLLPPPVVLVPQESGRARIEFSRSHTGTALAHSSQVKSVILSDSIYYVDFMLREIAPNQASCSLWVNGIFQSTILTQHEEYNEKSAYVLVGKLTKPPWPGTMEFDNLGIAETRELLPAPFAGPEKSQKAAAAPGKGRWPAIAGVGILLLAGLAGTAAWWVRLRKKNRNADIPDESPEDISDPAQMERIETVKAFVRQNLERPLPLEEIAQAAGVSANWLSKSYKACTGRNLFDHIKELRIAKAKQLLKETKMNANEIARQTGFGTIRQFNRAFRDSTGKTPIEYRKSRLF